MNVPRTDRGLQNLRRALIPSHEHLEDNSLADLTTAEIAGNDIEALYPQEMAHLESCPACAQTYADLIEMTLAAFGGMAENAASVSPQTVYAAILARDLSLHVDETAAIPELARALAGGLPLLFVQPPVAEDISAPLFENLARSLAGGKTGALSPGLLARLIGRNLRALAIYLQGAADALWGTSVGFAAEQLMSRYSLQLNLAPQPAISTLGGNYVTGDSWAMLGIRAGQSLPLNFSLRAERMTELACRLKIVLDRPGLVDPSGRQVEMIYGGHTYSAHTNERGQVVFESIPIAAIPDLEIRFQL